MCPLQEWELRNCYPVPSPSPIHRRYTFLWREQQNVPHEPPPPKKNKQTRCPWWFAEANSPLTPVTSARCLSRNDKLFASACQSRRRTLLSFPNFSSSWVSNKMSLRMLAYALDLSRNTHRLILVEASSHRVNLRPLYHFSLLFMQASFLYWFSLTFLAHFSCCTFRPILFIWQIIFGSCSKEVFLNNWFLLALPELYKHKNQPKLKKRKKII